MRFTKIIFALYVAVPLAGLLYLLAVGCARL